MCVGPRNRRNFVRIDNHLSLVRLAGCDNVYRKIVWSYDYKKSDQCESGCRWWVDLISSVTSKYGYVALLCRRNRSANWCLRIYVPLTIFQSYLRFGSRRYPISEIQVARPGIEPLTPCFAKHFCQLVTGSHNGKVRGGFVLGIGQSECHKTSATNMKSTTKTFIPHLTGFTRYTSIYCRFLLRET